MRCPYCGYLESKVIDSRPAEEGATIRRRRECLGCQKRFTTYEIMERLPLVVIKRDGSRQTFDKNKLVNSMLKSCEKRTVSMHELESIADEIVENDLPRRLSMLPVTGNDLADMGFKGREIGEKLAEILELVMCAI